jgi:flavodoxin
MKSLVVYSSKTGNTKKLAETVFENIKGEKKISTTEAAPDPDGYDFIAVGFWFQAGKPDPETAKYLPKIKKNKRLFLFATHGAGAGSDHAKKGMKQAKELAPEANFAGSFSCQGEVNPKVLEKVKAKPQPPAWVNDAPKAIGHPDDSDMKLLKEILNNL